MPLYFGCLFCVFSVTIRIRIRPNIADPAGSGSESTSLEKGKIKKVGSVFHIETWGGRDYRQFAVLICPHWRANTSTTILVNVLEVLYIYLKAARCRSSRTLALGESWASSSLRRGSASPSSHGLKAWLLTTSVRQSTARSVLSRVVYNKQRSKCVFNKQLLLNMLFVKYVTFI